MILQLLEITEVWFETLARADDQHGGFNEAFPFEPLPKVGRVAAEAIHADQKGKLQPWVNLLTQSSKRFGCEIGAVGFLCQVFFQAAGADLQVWLP